MMSIVSARVDEQTKQSAAKVLNELGLSMSDAVRLLLKRIAIERTLPACLKMPNDESLAAMAEAERGEVLVFNTVEELFADLDSDPG